MADAGPSSRSSERPPKRRWFGLALALALVLGAVILDRRNGERDPEHGPVDQVAPRAAEAASLETGPEVGKLAPNFRLATADGRAFLLSDLRGTPVLLNFWATWCFSCITEMPLLEEASVQYGETAVVLGVNVGETPETAEIFATNFSLTFPLVLDQATTVAQAYSIRPMPTSFVIDANGVVVSVIPGVVSRASIAANLDPLLLDDV